MPARYAALPNPRSAPGDVEDEMEAAFDGSDDEEQPFVDARDRRSLSSDRDDDAPESQPLHPLSGSSSQQSPQQQQANGLRPGLERSTTSTGGYDFERVDYDYPPPGSPPRRDLALANNDWGNSNGLLPSSPIDPRFRERLNRPGRRRGWFQRAATAVLPNRVAQTLGVGDGAAEGARTMRVGGGLNNDGVFANVTAKPSVPRQVEGEDGVYVLPETAQKDAPPSYATAQADAVPPYWETTIHLPSGFPGSGGPAQPGELLIDGLATGTLFSFLWNMLVSISFQFVGFLLTYLMHTTHAAKLGSRAGLGLTLIQYGFALRTGREGYAYSGEGYGGGPGGMGGGGGDGEAMGLWDKWNSDAPTSTAVAASLPTFATAGEAEDWMLHHPNLTSVPATDSLTDADAMNAYMGDMTNEWLAFLLMTIGWFILLTSLLGFWRVKRWERSILTSQSPPASTPQSAQTRQPTNEAPGEADGAVLAHIERTFGLRLPTPRLIRQGLGFGLGGSSGAVPPRPARAGRDEEEGVARESEEDVLLYPIISPSHPDRARVVAEAYAQERRLQQDLRAAGLL